MANQYQTELAAVIEKGGDVEQFKDDWRSRACESYWENVKTEADIHKFRCGDFKI